MAKHYSINQFTHLLVGYTSVRDAFLRVSHCDVFRSAVNLLDNLRYPIEVIMLIKLVSSDCAAIIFDELCSLIPHKKVRRTAIAVKRAIAHIYMYGYGLEQAPRVYILSTGISIPACTCEAPYAEPIVSLPIIIKAPKREGYFGLHVVEPRHVEDSSALFCSDRKKTARFIKMLEENRLGSIIWFLKSLVTAEN